MIMHHNHIMPVQFLTEINSIIRTKEYFLAFRRQVSVKHKSNFVICVVVTRISEQFLMLPLYEAALFIYIVRNFYFGNFFNSVIGYRCNRLFVVFFVLYHFHPKCQPLSPSHALRI